MATVEETRERVTSILTDALDLRIELGKGGVIIIRFGDASTAVFINIDEFGKEDKKSTAVSVSAPILRGVPASPELFKWIAIVGTGYRFGTVEAFEEEGGTIFLRYKYSVLGDFLDEEELKLAVFAVMSTADDLDDELQKKFGGKRMVDKD